MDELGGEWTYSYGAKGKRRTTTIETSVISVRAGTETTRALQGAPTIAPKQADDVIRRISAAMQVIRDELRDEDHGRFVFRVLLPLVEPDFSRWSAPSLLFDRVEIGHLRAVAASFRARGRQKLASSIDALVVEHELLFSDEPAKEIRDARDGTWVTLSASVVERSETLARTAGSLALVEQGTVRLLTDSAFGLLAEELSMDELHRVLREKGWVLKSRLSFHPRAIVVQPSSRDGSSFVALRRAFTEVPSIFERIEPIFLEPIHGRWRPNDPRYPEQWQWNNDGRNGGTRGADIRAERAWDRTRGKGVRVAVIDNGIHINHPDLKAAIKRGGWFDGSTSGSASFIELSASNRAQFPTDDHGTFCAGMVGARANKQGGCGAAPECELVAIACLEDQVGTQLTLARAIAYAADPSREVADSKERGADVISCSLGPNGADWEMSTPLELAIEFATSKGRGGKGTPIFWAASNAPVDIKRDEVVSHPSVIAVSRSNNNDGYDNAAYGASLAFVAPGVDVLSTSGAKSYATKTGCSFAAPLAAGVAALVVAKESHLTAAEVRKRLCDTCDKVGDEYGPDGRNDQMGHGRINADRAVR